MKLSRIAILLLLTSVLSFGQNLKTQGKKIVDENGTEVLLRGMGLGGWMLMEGYMMQTSGFAGTQHEFREKLTDLIGAERTDEFFNAWLDNHVTKADIDSLAAWGFNSVRLPMHYNLYTLPIEEEPVQGEQTWLNKGFELTDQLLDWCEENSMYLILDLHAAPGGQGTAAEISDYDPDKPSLWGSEDNKTKTIELWRKLANRYKDEPWIGGYDLINEVNNFDPNNQLNIGPNNIHLRTLYEDITEAIRDEGDDHIIYIEGNSYANDHTGLTPPWDDNMVYSFHKYWNTNGPNDLDWIMTLRDQYEVPLWMGEAGENSNVWFNEAITLLEENDIGWAWWPMKRVETIVGPYHIKWTDGYNNVLRYWKGEIAKPDANDAYEWMMELAINSNSANCIYNRDVPDAMIRQTYSDEPKPYKYHSIPGLIHLTDFDMGKINITYNDHEYANYGSGGHGNLGYMYRNDGVDIRRSPDQINSNGFYVGYTHRNEWMKYTVNIEESGIYKANVRVASIYSGGKFSLLIDDEEVTGIQQVTSTNSWESFETHEIEDIYLTAGKHVFTFYIDNDVEFNMGSIEFVKTGEANAFVFNEISGHTLEDRTSVVFSVSEDLNASSINGDLSQFTLTVNNEVVPITGISMSENGNRTIKLSTDSQLLYSNNIKLSYSGLYIKSQANEVLGAFTDLEIRNTLPVVFALPGKIESEEFSVNNGFSVQELSQNPRNDYLGYTDAGDYVDYEVFVEENSNWEVNLNVSANWDSELGLYLVYEDGTETELATLTIANTGGWFTYNTISTNISLPMGYSTIRMKALNDGFNIDWMDFVFISVNLDEDIDKDGVLNEDDLCPNTPEGAQVDATGCQYFVLPADNFEIVATGEECAGDNNGKITVRVMDETYDYSISINGLNPQTLTNPMSYGNLSVGDYEICITVNGQDYVQCFQVTVNAGTALKGKTTVDSKKAFVEISQGTAPFAVFVNGQRTFETYSNSFDIDVQHGDEITVYSSKACEGQLNSKIEMFETVTAFPNPTQGDFEIAIPGNRKEVNIDLYNVQMQLVSSKSYKVFNNKVNLTLENKPIGVYIAKVHLEKTVPVKIIKQ